MTPERWQRVKEIFQLALQLALDERSVYLASACGGDKELQQEVESLISSHEKPGKFIDSPAYQAASEFLAVEAQLKPGQQIGSYEVVSFVSRGGMAEVYVAQDRRLSRRVALKLLLHSHTIDKDRLLRFEQEARAASALNHPNIITIYEILKTGSTDLIVTEFVEGETLRARLSRSAISLEESVHISIQVADALAAAHKAGIVHRDIKPENIMQRPDGYVKVLDFGLAKLAETDSVLTMADAPTKRIKTGSGMILGTIGYMSPEQARGLPVDTRSDVFSLGALIYEMVAHRRPFEGDTASDVLAAILKTEPPLLSHLSPEAPAELIRIVTKALRKDPELRYQVIKDMLLDLKSLKEEIDFQAKLDRSVAPSRTGEASAAISQSQALAPEKRRASTDEIKTAVSTIKPPITIWRVSPHGGDPVQLTQPGRPEGGHSLPAVSPDGKRIMFVAYAGYNPGQLWNVAANGGDLRQAVKNNLIWFRGPVYAPDGQSVYSGGVSETGSFFIYRIPISPVTGEATGEPLIIKDLGLAHIRPSPTISADGKKLVYSTETPSGELMSISISPSSSEALGDPKPLVQSSGYRKSLPTFSRDGQTIAYLQWNVGENQKIWLMDANGGNARQLTSGREVNWSQSWLPDNDIIVYLSQADEGQEIRAISISTGRDRLLFKAPQSMGWPRVSPDGQQVAFLSAKGETINVWVMPITGGSPRQLTFDRDTIGWPSWSPDGKTLAIQMERGSNTYLGIVPSSGGEVTQLTFENGLVFPHHWSPDGDKILFGAQRNGVWNVYWYSLSTKEQKQLTHYTTRNHYVRYPSWSPQNNQVAYEYSQSTGNIWLMEMK